MWFRYLYKTHIAVQHFFFIKYQYILITLLDVWKITLALFFSFCLSEKEKYNNTYFSTRGFMQNEIYGRQFFIIWLTVTFNIFVAQSKSKSQKEACYSLKVFFPLKSSTKMPSRTVSLMFAFSSDGKQITCYKITLTSLLQCQLFLLQLYCEKDSFPCSFKGLSFRVC